MMSATAIDAFKTHRSNLIGLVYRITGSRAEAEDIVQEIFIKWIDTDHQKINSARAWLMKIATRMALDYMKSASVKRVSYIGPWLPEPYIEENRSTEQELEIDKGNISPDKELELDESISMALLVLLEILSPAERASFILHDLFHFDFEEIGEILEKSESSCRKLASRARLKIGKDPIGAKQNTDEHIQMLTAFFNAIKNGDVTGLVALLKENVTLHPDGGGKAMASLEMVKGAVSVSEFLMEKVRPGFMASESTDVTIRMTWFNGSPGLIVRDRGTPVTAFNFEMEAGVIKNIHALRNPDKLRVFNII
jgi:RNA polymerase sigma-70 factor (ECF subfamily)